MVKRRKEDKEITIKLKAILSLVEEAYRQEQERLKTLNQKADYLTKYVSVFLVLLNIVVPLLVKYTSINLLMSFLAYILVFLPGAISLIFAVKEQKLSKICKFPLGRELLDKTKGKYETEEEWLKLKIEQFDRAVKILEDNNEKKVSDIKFGYNLYIASVIMLTIFTLIIIILEYVR